MFRLTRAGYYADFALLPACALLLLAWNCGALLLWAFGGFMAWTLAEYLIHRFVFHHVPLLRRDHDRHHREPSAYIGAGSWITLPIFVLLWLGARWLWGGAGDAAAIGFAAGYYHYIAVHDQFHHARLRPGDWLYPAYHRHALHHRQDKINFGVSVPWWDLAFRTYRR